MELFGEVTRSTTIGEILDMMQESGAGIFQQALTDDAGNPQHAIIIVDGAEEAQKIVAAVEAVAKDW